MDIWSILALQVVALLGGALTGGAALVLGGAGSMRVLTRRMELLEELADHTAERITSEVKKRASQAAVEKREKAASVEQQAAEILDAAKKPLSSPAKRPSVVAAQ